MPTESERTSWPQDTTLASWSATLPTRQRPAASAAARSRPGQRPVVCPFRSRSAASAADDAAGWRLRQGRDPPPGRISACPWPTNGTARKSASSPAVSTTNWSEADPVRTFPDRFSTQTAASWAAMAASNGSRWASARDWGSPWAAPLRRPHRSEFAERGGRKP